MTTPPLKNLYVQLAVIAVLGGSIGLRWKQHRVAEAEWHATHYRLHEKANFPLAKGFPFREQFFVTDAGERVVVPLKDGRTVDRNGATWWSVEDSGRMRLFGEDREEVFPTVTEVE